MNRIEKAFEELKSRGLPVFKYEHTSGYFQIDTERVNFSKMQEGYYLDYYDEYHLNQNIERLLNKYDLYFEWENPAVASVHDQ